jgi:hypothetical protein
VGGFAFEEEGFACGEAGVEVEVVVGQFAEQEPVELSPVGDSGDAADGQLAL